MTTRTRSWASSIVDGTTTHVRSGAQRHTFAYRYRSFLVDLDELPTLERRAWPLFGVDRRRLVSLRTSDHLSSEDGATIRDRVHACLARHEVGSAPRDGRIIGLVTLRGLGTGFDPVTLWHCFDVDAAETLRAVVVDVHNTYGESHPYVLDAATDLNEDGNWLRASFDKRFHVSPFLGLDGEYAVELRPITAAAPAADTREQQRVTLRITMSAADSDDRLFAMLDGERRPLNGRRVAFALARRCLQGVTSSALIRREAFRLWRRGAAFRSKPQYQRQQGSHATDRAGER